MEKLRLKIGDMFTHRMHEVQLLRCTLIPKTLPNTVDASNYLNNTSNNGHGVYHLNWGFLTLLNLIDLPFHPILP